MAKFRVKSQELIPKERNLVKDVLNEIDLYSNFEFEQVSKFIETLIRAIIRDAVLPVIDYSIKPRILDKRTSKYINTFGWTYKDFQNTINQINLKISNNIPISKKEEDPLGYFIDDMVESTIHAHKYRNIVAEDLHKFALFIVERNLKQLAFEEGYGKLDEIILQPNISKLNK